MRIIIDTEKNAIICPKPFWTEVEKKNQTLKEAGIEPVSHKDEVRKYFEKAMEGELKRAQDLK